MKIVHFASCTGHGGDVVAMLRWASGQSSLGHDVKVLLSATEHTPMFVRRCAEVGIAAIDLPDVPLLDPAPAAVHAWKLWRHLRAERPDILHMHTGEAAMRLADIWAAQALGRRVVKVVTPQGGIWHNEDHARRWRAAAQKIDGIISPSFFAKKFQLTAGLPEQSVRVVHNAIDLAPIDAGRRDKLRGELNLAPDAELVLFFARLDAVKHPLDAIEAFAHVAPDFPKAVFALAGIGKLGDQCRRLAAERGVAERVRFLGYRTDTADCLQAADIFILPTDWENFSLSLLEAMGASLPIVTTPAGGNLEAVKDRESAWVADVGDIEGFAAGLRFFLSHPSERTAYGAAARRRVLEHFTAEAAARKLMEVYAGFDRSRSGRGK